MRGMCSRMCEAMAVLLLLLAPPGLGHALRPIKNTKAGKPSSQDLLQTKNVQEGVLVKQQQSPSSSSSGQYNFLPKKSSKNSKVPSNGAATQHNENSISLGGPVRQAVPIHAAANVQSQAGSFSPVSSEGKRAIKLLLKSETLEDTLSEDGGDAILPKHAARLGPTNSPLQPSSTDAWRTSPARFSRDTETFARRRALAPAPTALVKQGSNQAMLMAQQQPQQLGQLRSPIKAHVAMRQAPMIQESKPQKVWPEYTTFFNKVNHNQPALKAKALQQSSGSANSFQISSFALANQRAKSEIKKNFRLNSAAVFSPKQYAPDGRTSATKARVVIRGSAQEKESNPYSHLNSQKFLRGIHDSRKLVGSANRQAPAGHSRVQLQRDSSKLKVEGTAFSQRPLLQGRGSSPTVASLFMAQNPQ